MYRKGVYCTLVCRYFGMGCTRDCAQCALVLADRKVPGTMWAFPMPWYQPLRRADPSRAAATLTSWARDSTCIFRITRPRWAFTVISLIPSSAAICLFGRPATTRAMISR